VFIRLTTIDGRMLCALIRVEGINWSNQCEETRIFGGICLRCRLSQKVRISHSLSSFNCIICVQSFHQYILPDSCGFIAHTYVTETGLIAHDRKFDFITQKRMYYQISQPQTARVKGSAFSSCFFQALWRAIREACDLDHR